MFKMLLENWADLRSHDMRMRWKRRFEADDLKPIMDSRERQLPFMLRLFKAHRQSSLGTDQKLKRIGAKYNLREFASTSLLKIYILSHITLLILSRRVCHEHLWVRKSLAQNWIGILAGAWKYQAGNSKSCDEGFMMSRFAFSHFLRMRRKIALDCANIDKNSNSS